MRAFFYYEHYTGANRISSLINTTAQQARDTLNRLAPSQAIITPIIRARAPDMGLWVAPRIAGKVITASVT